MEIILANPWHVGWLREGVPKWNKRRKKVKFAPDLSSVDFFELLPPDFRDAPKTSRYFEKIDLSDADLSNSSLSRLNFASANFKNADLSNVKMTNSNFSDAKFVGSKLTNVDASGSYFENTRFEVADAEGADFEGVEANRANFISTDLSSLQIGQLQKSDIRVFASRAAFEARKQSELIHYFEHVPLSDATVDTRTVKNKYDVFFGTNRESVFERGELTGFNGERGSQILYGVCEVIIPESHRIGSIGSPLWKRLKNRKDDRLKIDEIIPLDSELFFEYLLQSAKKMKVKAQPTIFVHGFNVTFKDAVLRAAQIGYDLGLGQGIGLFSWPSKGKKKKYPADEASVEVSKYLLADFIEQFVSNTNGEGVNIIAHSMGCRCLLGAFEVLSKDRADVLGKIDQTILAAADVDVGHMEYLGKHAVDHPVRTTSYISDLDKALKVSGWLHDFKRVGLTPPTFVMNGLDTVLVNDLELGNFEHGYVGTSRTVLNDIFQLIKENTAPEDRFSLEALSEKGQVFWRLKN